jgi:hypothetical protein
MLSEAALAMLLTSVPTSTCTPKIDVAVIAEHLPPAIRSTYDLDEIRELAKRSGRPLRHETLGFYLSTFGYNVGVDIKKGVGSECDVVIAQVRLILDGRLIEIPKDLESLSCQRDVVVSHYMLHAQFDDKALSVYANRAHERLRTSRLGDPGQADLRDTTAAAIRKVMDEVLQSYDQDRGNALAAADNATELNRLSGACARAI